MTSSFIETLDRARNGDTGAVGELLLPHLAGLTAFVRLRMPGAMRQRESSADVVQSLCREVINDLGQVRARDEPGFKAWLYGAVTHKLAHKRDFHRAARRDVGREQALGFDSRVDDGTLLEHYRAMTPSQDAVAREEIARIETAFDQLPEDYRDVILHVGIAGLRYGEAAQLMGRSEDSVRQLIHRARARLATLLD